MNVKRTANQQIHLYIHINICIYIYIYTDKTTLRVIRRLGGWGRGSSTDDNSCRHSLPPPSPLKPSYHTKGNKTKCMTKSGQGSLVKVMEHSFSLCIEKAREQTQGAGSTIVKWFNLQSLTEVNRNWRLCIFSSVFLGSSAPVSSPMCI